jgi:hypothetical protein
VALTHLFRHSSLGRRIDGATIRRQFVRNQLLLDQIVAHNSDKLARPYLLAVNQPLRDQIGRTVRRRAHQHPIVVARLRQLKDHLDQRHRFARARRPENYVRHWPTFGAYDILDGLLLDGVQFWIEPREDTLVIVQVDHLQVAGAHAQILARWLHLNAVGEHVLLAQVAFDHRKGVVLFAERGARKVEHHFVALARIVVLLEALVELQQDPIVLDFVDGALVALLVRGPGFGGVHGIADDQGGATLSDVVDVEGEIFVFALEAGAFHVILADVVVELDLFEVEEAVEVDLVVGEGQTALEVLEAFVQLFLHFGIGVETVKRLKEIFD